MNFPITKLTLPNDEYVREKTNKKMIFLHHSAGWDNVRGMFNYWAEQKGRVATSFGINDPGEIFQAFDDDYWAYHLYIRSRGNNLPTRLLKYKQSLGKAQYLEKISIGVEIANFGQLVYRGGKYYAWPNDFGTRGKGVEIPESEVYDFGKHPFRGYRFYQKYTDSEIGALKVLLKGLADKHADIVLDTPGNIFEINDDAFKGRPGIYTHCSVRTDKRDVVPQQNLVDMLESICI